MVRLPFAMLTAACAATLYGCAGVSTYYSPSAERGERALRMIEIDCAPLQTKLDSIELAIEGLEAERGQLFTNDREHLAWFRDRIAWLERSAQYAAWRTLKDKPDCAVPYVWLGDEAAAFLHSVDVQAEVAETYYQTGLKANPNDPGLLARAAWMREMYGDVDSARVLYQQAGTVHELGIDGSKEAARLSFRYGFRDRFKTAGDEVYVELRIEPELVRTPYVWLGADTSYVRVFPSGRCEYNIPLVGRGRYVHGSVSLPESQLDSILMSLERADILRLRNVLDTVSNHYVYALTTHSDVDVITVHTSEFEHSVSVDALSWGPDSSIESYRAKLGLGPRLDDLARAADLFYVRPWITKRLDQEYGTHRPFYSCDGLARFDSVTNTVTCIRLPDFGVEWRVNLDTISLSTPTIESKGCHYVFDIGKRVVAFLLDGGHLLYSLSLDETEWPYLATRAQRLYFAKFEDSTLVAEVYDVRRGTPICAGVFHPEHGTKITAWFTTRDKRGQQEEKSLLFQVAQDVTVSKLGMRPATETPNSLLW